MKNALAFITGFTVMLFIFWYGGLDLTVRQSDNGFALFFCLLVGGATVLLYNHPFGDDKL